MGEERFEWVAAGRAAREAYDALPPGDRAVLKRAHDREDLFAEGAFWRVVSSVPSERRAAMATLVWCFKAADAKAMKKGEVLSFGLYARRALSNGKGEISPTGLMRFRQLVAARDEDELARRMRQLITQCATPVDWGSVAKDLAAWRSEDGRPVVCRRWAEAFYVAPAKNGSKVAVEDAGASKENA